MMRGARGKGGWKILRANWSPERLEGPHSFSALPPSSLTWVAPGAGP
jgi:hypothetical protein